MFINWKLPMLILVLTLCGQAYAGEIFGGHEAAPHSRPYMALLKRTLSNGSTRYCGGFLLNEDFVMTAAHCQAKSYTVFLGAHNMGKNEKRQEITVKQTFPHEDYNDTSYINDVMLLKLSSKAKFSENVKPIALPPGNSVSLPKSCSITGWGRANRSSDYMSNILMEVSVDLINDYKCTKNNFYCSVGEEGPGEGDSGGPLVCEDSRAYGVVSSTFKPHSGGPEVHRYAKVTDYRGWIKSTVKKALKKV